MRKYGTRGWLITVAVVCLVLTAIGFTVFGVGPDDHAVASGSGDAWLWSRDGGQLARVNAATGRVDTRFTVTDAAGHLVDVSQTDGHLVLRDRTTGEVSAIDLTSLRVSATTPTTAGDGISVALRGSDAFIVDSVQGLVSQLDPTTLQPIGEPLRFPPGLAGGTFDSAGDLWLALPGDGTVVDIIPAGSSQAAGSPRVRTTVSVAPAAHDLRLSTLDSGVAVMDNTTRTLTTVRGGHPHAVQLPSDGTATMPAHSSGSTVAVTAPDKRRVYVIDGAGSVSTFVVPGTGSRLEPVVAFGGRFYCADNASGTIYVLDGTGKLSTTLTLASAGGGVQIEVHGGDLYINAPASSNAFVIDDKNQVKTVNKGTNGIPGGDTPPPSPPTLPVTPAGPRVPGSPPRVTAAGGDRQATIAWDAAAPRGAAILRYVVEGDGTRHEVAPDHRSLVLIGLTNGHSYTFTVYAVNSVGAGAKGRARTVAPTSDVPDPPASVNATASPDGTVTLSWSAANGEGRRISSYRVTAVGPSSTASVGTSGGTSVRLPAGRLPYGVQVAFTVATVNDKGGTSTASTPFQAYPEGFQKIAPSSGCVRPSASTARDRMRCFPALSTSDVCQ